MDMDQLRKDIRTQGLEVILLSNPRNPTGQVVQGEELKELVETARESSTTMILDEVRAHFIVFYRILTRRASVLLLVHLPRK